MLEEAEGLIGDPTYADAILDCIVHNTHRMNFTATACDAHAREAGAKFNLEQVDLREKKTKKGDDYWKINPKGQVPLLELDDGQMISEGPAIVQYVADKNPGAGIIPAAGCHRPLSPPGLAHPYRNRAAQDLRTDVPPNHPRRVQEDFQGDAREQVQEHRQDARR